MLSNTSFSQTSNKSDSSSYYLQKAKEANDARKYWEAEKFFKKAAELAPTRQDIKFELANYYGTQRKYYLALPFYQQILQQEPNNKPVLAKAIETAFWLSKWEDVIALGKSIKAINLAVNKLDFMIGKAYYEDEDFGKAKTFLELQKIATPMDKETLLLLARVYMDLKKFDEAINTYQTCLTILPNNADILNDLGMLYSVQEKNELAVQYFELAVAKGYKADLSYLENLGSAAILVDVEKGVQILNKVLEKKPDDVECLMQIARAYFRNEKFEMAYSYYQKIYLIDQSNPNALYMSGLALIRKGEKNKGASICEEAISRKPELARQKMALITKLK